MKDKFKLNIQLFGDVTMLEDMVDPEVMAPMISAKITNAIVATPFAKIDTTLEGRPGSTITVPRYKYIGDAEDVAEGETADTVKLETDTDQYTVKKAMKAVTLTDEAVLSGYGNPVGEANAQLGKSIASKIDNDVIDELLTAPKVYNATEDLNYDEIVNAIDLFNEEENVPKVMFVAPHQVTTLRKDTNFISNDKYPNNVIMRGEIGMIANTRIVPSRKVEVAEGEYHCPIVQLRAESQTGDEERAAVTIFLKRNANVETERHTLNRTTDISVDEHYVAALTDESKVVIAKFGGEVSL